MVAGARGGPGRRHLHGRGDGAGGQRGTLAPERPRMPGMVATVGSRMMIARTLSPPRPRTATCARSSTMTSWWPPSPPGHH